MQLEAFIFRCRLYIYASSWFLYLLRFWKIVLNTYADTITTTMFILLIMKKREKWSLKALETLPKEDIGDEYFTV